MESIKIFIDWWIKYGVYTHGVSSSYEKKGIPAICSNMSQTEGHYAKWNKFITKGQILNDSLYKVSKNCQTHRE